MIWDRSSSGRSSFYAERRVRRFVEAGLAVSESAVSLAFKLRLSPRDCRAVLETLASEGIVQRHDYGDTEPIFNRFPGR